MAKDEKAVANTKKLQKDKGSKNKEAKGIEIWWPGWFGERGGGGGDRWLSPFPCPPP